MQGHLSNILELIKKEVMSILKNKEELKKSEQMVLIEKLKEEEEEDNQELKKYKRKKIKHQLNDFIISIIINILNTINGN